MLFQRARYRGRVLSRTLRSPLARLFFVVFLFANIVQVWRVHRALSSERLHTSYSNSNSLSSRSRVPEHSRRVYIAAIHWNSGKVLRSHWNNAVVALADALGPENVYISIHESGSWDDSKDALMDLDSALAARGIDRLINISERTHKDEIGDTPGGPGWIKTVRGGYELRRIPYLSKLRNMSLKRLSELQEEGIEFDRVLFLNDVVFTVCVPCRRKMMAL